MIPLFLKEGETWVLFTRRTETVGTHKGEISFPGGAVDPGDRGPREAALRELAEELGIQPNRVKTAGILDDILTLSRFRITPVVGVIQPPYHLRPNPQEIEAVLEIPLRCFLDPRVFRVEEHLEFQGRLYPVNYFELPEVTVWGATAKILRQFLEVCCDWVPHP